MVPGMISLLVAAGTLTWILGMIVLGVYISIRIWPQKPAKIEGADALRVRSFHATMQSV